MKTKDQILQAVNFKKMMAAERYEEALRVFFDGQAEIIAECIQGGYEDHRVFAYRFDDGTVVILTGCCGVWDDVTSKEVSDVSTTLANAHIFSSVEDAIQYCEVAEDNLFEYPFRATKNFIDQLRDAQ